MPDQLWPAMMAAAAQAINNDLSIKLLLFWNQKTRQFILVPTNMIGDLGVTLMNPDNQPLCIISATDVAKFEDEQLMATAANNWFNYVETLSLNPMSTHLTDIATINLSELTECDSETT